MNVEWKKLVREARKQGWTLEEGQKGQIKMVPPDPTKQIVYVHGTPSDQRAIKNKVAEMRRQGFQWPPQRKGKR